MVESRKYYGIIYKATFPNGKMYVGQTTRELQVRIAQHIGTRNSENFPFHRAIKKYGTENIIWEIIDYGDSRDDLNEKERYWIKELKTYTGFRNSQGYNADLGGGRHEIFGPLDDIELEEFGKDYFSGMSKNDLHNKYNKDGKLNRHLFFEILNGKQWGSYTKIPRRDFSIEPMRSPFTPIQVDKILERFKECGDTRTIADEYGVAVNLITHIVKGKNWEKYTGIIDDSFYNKYVRVSPVLTNEEIKEIGKMKKEGKTLKEIKENFSGVNVNTIRRIYNGEKFSEISGISLEIRDFQKNPINSKITYIQVDEIVKLRKEGKAPKEIEKLTSIDYQSICRILNGDSWSEYTGYTKESNIGSHTKLFTKEEVLAVREDREKGLSFREIARKYDTDSGIISNICNGKTYKQYTNGIPVKNGNKNN